MNHSECHWDCHEVAVAEILTELWDLIPAYDYLKRWGAKRKRSAISQHLSGTKGKSNAANSPATPLMFSPSESEDKGKRLSSSSGFSVFKRKNKEELMQSFTDLTHQKDSLVKEMEAVKRHLDNLKASNLELKNRKQMINGLAPPELYHHHPQLHYPHPTLHLQQQAFRLQYPAIQWSGNCFLSSSQSSSAGKMIPAGLPDLNLTLEEAAATGNVERYQPSDGATMMMKVMDYNNVNRALASAQARKRRMQIYKEKNLNQILRQR